MGGFSEAFELGFEVFVELYGFLVVVVVGWDLGGHEDAGGDRFLVGGSVGVVLFFVIVLTVLCIEFVFIPCVEDFLVDGPGLLVFGVGVVLGVDHDGVVFGDVGCACEEAGGEACVGDEEKDGEGGD